jgi:hypothetical protein
MAALPPSNTGNIDDDTPAMFPQDQFKDLNAEQAVADAAAFAQSKIKFEFKGL